MRFGNPLLIYDEYYDSELLSMEATGDGNPLLIMLITLKILVINLVFGCVITLILFKLRHIIGSCFNSCCEDCDCGNDGNGRRLLNRHRKRRQVDNSNSPFSLLFSCVSCSSMCLWVLNTTLKYYDQKMSKRVVSLMFGLIIGYFGIIVHSPQLKVEKPTPILFSFSSPEIYLKNIKDSGRVFFITPTAKSGVQVPRLIKLAQALFPNKDFVTWVVVSTDPVRKEFWSKRQFEHWSGWQTDLWKVNESAILNHLQGLKETLERFGIPYILISGHLIHHQDRGFQTYFKSTSYETFMKASHIGISWVVNTFQDGSLLVGVEDTAYNLNLFREIRQTEKISAWPSAFDERYALGLSTPILNKRRSTVKGFFGGGTLHFGDIPMGCGTYAVNLKFARQLQSSNSLRKLSSDKAITSKELNISTNTFQPMGKNCSEVYLWRLSTVFNWASITYRQKLPIKKDWEDSNIPSLTNKVKSWFGILL